MSNHPRGEMAFVTDVLGNRFRKEALVLIAIGSTQQLGQVIHVEQPPLIRDPNNNPVPTTGKLVVQIILPLEVQSGVPVQGVWVLQEPPADGVVQ